MTGQVLREKIITRADVRARPDVVFAFGDNAQRRGFGGQAKEMRGEPNAVGVPTKWAPSNRPNAFFSDVDFAAAKLMIGTAFDRLQRALQEGRDVVIPADGLGTGIADLLRRAPKIYAYVEERIAGLSEQDAR